MNKTDFLHELKNIAQLETQIEYDTKRILFLERKMRKRLFVLCDRMLEFIPEETEDERKLTEHN